jgi:hypothetical protein
MTASWKDGYARDIMKATADLPRDTPLQERIKVVDRVGAGVRGSWPRKAWQAARREYLVKFGYVPRTKAARDQVENGLPIFGQENCND